MFTFLLYLVTFIFLIILGSKLYIKVQTRWNNSYTCLVGKTAIVTGSNTGIGYATALDFAMRGARVILACRNEGRAEDAKDEIIKATGNENVHVKLVDFTSLQSVRDFCKDINETEEKVHILVNNAGAGGLGNHFTKDNFQITWHVNYLSPFLITHLLIDTIKNSAPSRIVNVASVTAKYSNVHIDNINTYPDENKVFKSDNTLYGYTKQCNILFTRELARRLAGTGVNTYALHPGVVFTDIFRRLPKAVIGAVYFLLKLILKSPEEGAQTTIHCAVSKDLDRETGKLYEECREIEMYKSCMDMNLAKQLWEKSEEIVKLNKPEKI